METFTITFLFGILCFIAGWKLREMYAVRIMNKLILNAASQVQEEMSKNIITVNVEDHEGQFFIYDQENGAYLAHSSSRETLEKILKEKFPGMTFKVSEQDLKKLQSR